MQIDHSNLDEPGEAVRAEVLEEVDQPVNQDSLRKATGQGFSWLSFCLVIGKCLHFLSQLILGKILLDEDFGIFAIASSIAMFLRVFNDGGVAQVLVQRGESQFSRLSGPAFWIAMSFGLAAGLVLAGIAPLAAYIYDEQKLLPMILLFAITMPLSTPSTIFKAKLRMDLRFQTVAWISIVWFMIRYLGVVLFALLGFGVMSFVIPLPIVALFELFATYAATRIKPWRRKLKFREWNEIIGSSFWVMGTAFFRGLTRNGDYMVLGLLVSKAVLGQYFFGYQIAVQFALLMATNIQYVLYPVMSRLATDPARQAKAIVRTIRLMILVAAPFSMIVAATIKTIELLVWQEKWALAVPLMQIFAVAAPIRLLPEIVHTVITSRGQFRKSALLVLTEGLLLMLSAWLAVELFGINLTQIALFVASTQVAFSILLTLVILRGYGIRLREVLGAFLPTWIASAAVAAVTIVISRWYFTGVPLFAQLLLEIGLFSLLFCVLARSLFANQLDELASVVPRPLEGLVRRVFFLKRTSMAQN